MSCTVFPGRACPGVVSVQQAKQAWVSGSGLSNGRPVCAHVPTVASWVPMSAQGQAQSQGNPPTQGGPPVNLPPQAAAAGGYALTLTCPIDQITVSVQTPEDHRGCS